MPEACNFYDFLAKIRAPAHDCDMRRSLAFASLSILLAAVVAGACKQKTSAAQGGGDDDDAGAQTADNDPNTDDGTSSEDDANQVPVLPSNGIPCDVESVLENRCLGCHGATDPKGPPLLKFEDFSAKSNRDPAKTRGQLAAELMKSKEMPKAPGVATDTEIATVDAWVTGGMAKSTESCTTAAADAGTIPSVDGGTVDAGTTASACLSGKTTSGESGKGEMHPGRACLDCHQKNGGPPFLFAGTVFDELHQPDECFGSNAPVKVTIVGKRGPGIGGGGGGGRSNVYVTTVNAAGNFFVTQDDLDAADVKLNPPFSITLTQPGKPARRMNTRIPSGDCNGCHTVDGTAGLQGLGKPPGRIVAPGVDLNK